jgi:hypothetical protein
MSPMRSILFLYCLIKDGFLIYILYVYTGDAIFRIKNHLIEDGKICWLIYSTISLDTTWIK